MISLPLSRAECRRRTPRRRSRRSGREKPAPCSCAIMRTVRSRLSALVESHASVSDCSACLDEVEPAGGPGGAARQPVPRLSGGSCSPKSTPGESHVPDKGVRMQLRELLAPKCVPVASMTVPPLLHDSRTTVARLQKLTGRLGVAEQIGAIPLQGPPKARLGKTWTGHTARTLPLLTAESGPLLPAISGHLRIINASDC